MPRSATAVAPVWGRTPGAIRRLVVNAATNRLSRSAARALTKNRLRILGFHGIDDQDHFRQLLDLIADKYTPIDGNDIVAAIEEQSPLPPHPVWLTFDDGLQSTFDSADLLAEYGIRATIFVNPASIQRPGPLWFQTLAQARDHGVIDAREEQRFSSSRLKTIPDAIRRDEIAELADRVSGLVSTDTTQSGDVEDMNRWVALGHEIGNHTWDHPCLTQCSPIDQQSQILRAHEWLENKGFTPRFFAYPNGDWTSHSAAYAAELGYVASVLFNHRLAGPTDDPARLSRLRLDADADLRRADAILSGAHSALFGLFARVS